MKTFQSKLLLSLLCGLISIQFSCNRKMAHVDSTSKLSQKDGQEIKIVYSGPAKIKFDSTNYHLGILEKNEVRNFELPFMNVGAEPLEIKLISACECTTVDWPVLPIESGGKRKLKISYNSKDKKGLQIVDLDILSNTEPKNTFVKFELFVKEN